MTRKEKKELEEKKRIANLALIAAQDKAIENSDSVVELTKALKYLIDDYKGHVRAGDLWYIHGGTFNYLNEINKLIDTINKLKEE